MTVIVVGLSIGKTIFQNTLQVLHPSIMAASSKETGMDEIKPWYKNTPMPAPKPMYINTRPGIVSVIFTPTWFPIQFISCIRGIMIVWKGMSMVATNIPNKAPDNLFLLLTNIQAVIEQRITRIAMDTSVRMSEFLIDMAKFILPRALS